jgi:hypothetical protein
MDHVGIFMLIAGTYTPIASNLLRGRWRSATLFAAWVAAAAGASLHVLLGALPPWLSTGLYLGMGWGATFCYSELARTWSHRMLSPILIGGVLYSVGALVNLAHWPNPWPGVLDSHEVFHLFVIGGTATHVWFMVTVVLPKRAHEVWPTVRRDPFPSLPAPHWAMSRMRLVPLLVWTRESIRGNPRLRFIARRPRPPQPDSRG